MCPVCIVSTLVLVAGAGSSGGILAICIGRGRKQSSREDSASAAKNTGDIQWQPANASRNLEQAVSN
jgi:hypothetical protein